MCFASGPNASTALFTCVRDLAFADPLLQALFAVGGWLLVRLTAFGRNPSAALELLVARVFEYGIERSIQVIGSRVVAEVSLNLALVCSSAGAPHHPRLVPLPVRPLPCL